MSDLSTDLASSALNATVNFTNNGTPVAGDKIIIKVAVYDGSQYSNVHTYTFTVIA